MIPEDRITALERELAALRGDAGQAREKKTVTNPADPRNPDQLETALDRLFEVLCTVINNPVVVTRKELPYYLLRAANDLDRQGSYGAAWLFSALARQARETLTPD